LAEFNLFIYIFLFFEFQQEEVSFASWTKINRLWSKYSTT
jgi:hypothetical protein